MAAVATYGVLLLLWILNISRSDETGQLLQWLSLTEHYRPFISGLVCSGDIAYFLLLSGSCLWLTGHHLERRRSEA